MGLFRDRREAGQKLAQKLSKYAGRKDVIVLALPRGGVPVARQVADALQAPLDVFVVRKLGLPGQEELAIGAIASGGVRILNEELVSALQLPPSLIEAVACQEQQELERREQLYRDGKPPVPIQGQTVILVDDGLATGASMRAAVEAVRSYRPRMLVVAVPTAASETCARFADLVDEVVCAYTPEPFFGVGLWYDDFSQTTDEEVRRLLEKPVIEETTDKHS